MVNISKVTVYGTPWCPWCNRTKSYLDENAIAYDYVDVSSDGKAAMTLVERTGQRGVPVIDIDGTLIIGFDKARLNRLLGIA
jgi:glutaredoxin-like YruB-family protein